MKLLVLLAHPWEADLFSQQIAGRTDIRPENITLFSSDARTRAELKKRGFSCTSENDYDFPEASQGVSDRAYFLAESWWKNFYSLVPALDADGVNIPSLIEREAVYFFLWVLRTLSFTQALIAHVQPSEIWAGIPSGQETLSFRGGKEESLHGKIALDWAETRKIRSWVFKAPLRIQLSNFFSFQIQKSLLCFAGVRLRSQLIRTAPRFKEIALAFLKDLSAGIFSTLSRNQTSTEESAKPVLLISSSESHVAPVLNELKKRGLFHFAFLRETFSPAQITEFRKNGDLFHSLSLSGASKNVSGIAEFWDCNQERILADPVYTWQGYAFGNLLRGKLEFLFHSLFPALIRLREKMGTFLTEAKVSAVLVEEDACVFNKTLVRTASLLKIPSLVVQHGFAVLQVGFYPLSASKFAAYGEAAKHRLMEWGISEHRITLTGNVLHDKITDDIPSRENFCRELGLDPNRKIVLLGMFPYRDYSAADFPEVESGPANYFRLIETALKAVENLNDIQLIIKLHPRDSKFQECSEFLKKFPAVRAVTAQRGASVKYAANCDVLVTVLSTLLIDTLPFKKPMIVVDYSGQAVEKTQTMISMKIPVVPGNPERLNAEIQKALNSRTPAGLDEIAVNHLYRLDGLASKRAADAVCALVPALAPGDCHVSA